MRPPRAVVLAGLAALAVAGCGGDAGVACPDGAGVLSSVVLANNVESMVGDVEVGVANTASVRDGLSTVEQATLFVGPDDERPVTNGDTVDIGGVAWLVDVHVGDDPGVELVECG